MALIACLLAGASLAAVPGLAIVPLSLPLSTRMALSMRRDALDAEYQTFRAAADNFNAKTAENQTDAEAAQVEALQSEYAREANAFNREVGREMQAVKTPGGAATPQAFFVARGDFYVVTRDGTKVSAADLATVPLDGHCRLVTSGTGHVHLVLPDQTTFTIGPNSDMVLDSFVYDPDTSTRKISAEITKGLFRWVTGKVAGEKPFAQKCSVDTCAVSTAIRGTDFEISADTAGAGYLKLFTGQIEITEKKTSRKLMLNGGQRVTVSANGIVSEPVALAPSDSPSG